MEDQRSFYTYVRLADDDDTYVAQDFMSMSISKDPSGYRNNEILRTKKDSINNIMFSYPDAEFTLSKIGGKWLIDNMPSDSANTASYLSGLSLVTSRSFTESMGSPVKTVTLGFSNQEDIAVTMDDAHTINSSFNQYEYFNDSTVTEKLFKERSYFLQ